MRVLLACLLLGLGFVMIAQPASAARQTEVSGWVLDSDGTVTRFGSAPDLGNSTGSGTAVSMVTNAAGTGYWVLRSTGQVTNHGTARHFGDLSTIALFRPAVSLSLLPNEDGYIILGADGGVFAFGAARFQGSVPEVSPLAARTTTAVAIELESTGYRVIHDDGGVFAFDVPFRGSIPGALPPGTRLDQPIVDSVPGPNNSYAMVAADGGVFAFGGLSFSGSLGGSGRTDIVGATTDGLGGYAMVTKRGTITWFGSTQRAELAIGGVADAADVAISEVVVGDPIPTTTTPPTTTPPTTTPPTTSPPSSGAVTIWGTHTAMATASAYFQPNFNDQGNWLSPNITTGDALLRLNISTKPSSLAVDIQVCGWQLINGTNFSGGFKETCSPKTRFTDETDGTITINLGPPADWWKKNGEFPWNKGPDVMRLMIKDAASQKLLMSSTCGSACFSGPGPISDHLPITLTASLTFNN